MVILKDRVKEVIAVKVMNKPSNKVQGKKNFKKVYTKLEKVTTKK